MHDWKQIEHKVTIRNEPRLMVEVDVEPVDGCVTCEQNLKHGKQVILIYESELPKLESRTQTEQQKADWEAAKRQYESAFAQRVARIKDPAVIELERQRFGQSPSSFFEVTNPGGKPPIRSFKILSRDIPPPETPANLQANQMQYLADAFVRALSAAQQPAQASGKR